jgi:hypothetical protein
MEVQRERERGYRYRSKLSLTSALDTAVVKVTLLREVNPVPFVLEAGWATGFVWTFVV